MGARGPVVLGRVSGLYGVRGWVRVHSYTEPREALLDYRDWRIRRDGAWEAIALAEGRRHGKTVVARLAGVTDRDAAAAYVGADIAVDREQLPDAGKNRWYWADLEGLVVRHRDGRELGRVDHLLETGANDVMVVRREDTADELLIPFVTGTYVLGVDLDRGVIDVDWEWD